jgi:hypothetical protein
VSSGSARDDRVIDTKFAGIEIFFFYFFNKPEVVAIIDHLCEIQLQKVGMESRVPADICPSAHKRILNEYERLLS